jgi:hypothetical protein
MIMKNDWRKQVEQWKDEAFRNRYYEGLYQKLILAEIEFLQTLIRKNPDVEQQYRVFLKKKYRGVYSCAYFDKGFDKWLAKEPGTEEIVLAPETEDDITIKRKRVRNLAKDKVRIPKKL